MSPTFGIYLMVANITKIEGRQLNNTNIGMLKVKKTFYDSRNLERGMEYWHDTGAYEE